MAAHKTHLNYEYWSLKYQKKHEKMPTTFLCMTLAMGKIKPGMKCTTVLSERRMYTGADCTEGLPCYLEALIFMNIWNEKQS